MMQAAAINDNAAGAVVIDKWRRDPVVFAKDVLGIQLAGHQREVLHSVASNHRTAVRSAHGMGKTYTAAVAALWFLSTRPGARVVTTAPTWRQVSVLLWREIARLHAGAHIPIGGDLLQTELRMAPDWFAIGQSSDKPEQFAGHHARHLLLIADEASGVDERIYEAAEGFLTGADSRVLLIGNPTQLSGTFYKAFSKDKDLYATYQFSAEQSPAITGEELPADILRRFPQSEWIERMQAIYGTGSPVYAVRVLGNFPDQAENSVIGIAQAEAAQARQEDPGAPLVVACDVARYGDDETVIAVRQGMQARIIDTARNRDLMATAGRIQQIAREIKSNNPAESVRIVIDDVGVGGGVTDRLREELAGEKWATVEAFSGGQSPQAADKNTEYPNRRCEAWFAFSDQLASIDLDEDEQLMADLVAPRYKIDSAGRRVVEPKDETKKRLGRSPDRADAVIMLYAPAARRIDWDEYGSVIAY